MPIDYEPCLCLRDGWRTPGSRRVGHLNHSGGAGYRRILQYRHGTLCLSRFLHGAKWRKKSNTCFLKGCRGSH